MIAKIGAIIPDRGKLTINAIITEFITKYGLIFFKVTKFIIIMLIAENMDINDIVTIALCGNGG